MADKFDMQLIGFVCSTNLQINLKLARLGVGTILQTPIPLLRKTCLYLT